MKFIGAKKGRLDFQLDSGEEIILRKVLAYYPLIPVAHQKLSKSGEISDAQQLLEKSLAAQRMENKKRINAIFQNALVRVEEAESYRLSLDAGQVECLLQALNDVRVGSWLALGSPGGLASTIAAFNKNTLQYFRTMEMAGEFQMALLKAANAGAATNG